MKNNLHLLSEEEINKAKKLTVWLVWYEDRFAFGDDRDPAFPIDAFLSEAEADVCVNSHGGIIDSSEGKFDGCFTDRSNLYEILYLNLISIERAKELIRDHLK